MSAYAVIADDLTGAADAGARFRRAGLTVELALGEALPAGADVVVVNTASREATAEQAERVTTLAARRLRDAGVGDVFKKIDSTLKGHPGVEIAAFLRAAPEHGWALVCPAFPEQGRTVVDGRLCVHGRAAGLDVAALLSGQTASRIGLVPRAAVERGPGEVADRLGGLRGAGVEIVVADATSAADLEAIVAGAAELDGPPLHAGSAGLAAPVAAAWSRSTMSPVLAVIGSMQPEARGQARALSARPGWTTLEVAGSALAAPESAWLSWRRDAVAAVVARPPRAGVLVTSPQDPIPVGAAERLGALGRDLADALSPAGFIATGGETAAALLACLGVEGCRVLGELEPGIPVGRLMGGPAGGAPVVLKAGGFGGADVLTRACDVVGLLAGEGS